MIWELPGWEDARGDPGCPTVSLVGCLMSSLASDLGSSGPRRYSKTEMIMCPLQSLGEFSLRSQVYSARCSGLHGAGVHQTSGCGAGCGCRVHVRLDSES